LTCGVALAATALPASSGAASASAPYDFDGDGRQELVAGLPDIADGGAELAGAVHVVPGSESAVELARWRLISQSSEGVPDTSESSDGFGGAVASGDFNADGATDLAVGARYERFGASTDLQGAVTVLYGGHDGLTGVGATQFAGTISIYRAGGQAYSQGSAFGSALAAGDLDGDGYADLAVGATWESPRAENTNEAGAVHVLFGGGKGLTRARERVLRRPRRRDAWFGDELAMGDINRDGHLDLVEGAAGNPLNIDGDGIDGHLSYCPGAAEGPRSCRSVSNRSRSSVAELGVAREAPASIAIGDVTGDGYPDIVEGVPDDQWLPDSEGRTPAGVILIRRGTRHGPAKRPWRIDQETAGVPGRSEETDSFGAAVAVGRLDRDRYAEIVVGAPGENTHLPRDEWAAVGGRVTVLRGGRSGVRRSRAKVYDRRTRGIARTGLGFGSALALLDHNDDGRLDLTIGSPGVWNGHAPANGMLVTLLGRRRSFDTTRAVVIDSEGLGLATRTSTGLGTVIGH
jgi:hypothetical protein